MPWNSNLGAQQVIARCRELASFSEDPGSLRRMFLSPALGDCHRAIAGWLAGTGAEVQRDAVGNLRARYPGARPDAPGLLIGSHLDTVPNAGAYDGVLGVVIAVALLEALEGRRLPFGIEIVGFAEEEGVRFGVPFIGSRALVGRVDEELLNREDASGISVRSAIRSFGLDPAEIPRAALPADALAYLEFHIEQGPLLDSLGLPLAAVESISAQTRMEFVFLGSANHAGTTPMHLRRDALAAAAEWIVAVEHAALGQSGLVATVGRVEARPGAANVIAAEVRVTLDLRHPSGDLCAGSAGEMVRLAGEITARRGIGFRHGVLLTQREVPMDPFLVNEIDLAIRAAGCPPCRMNSGAGHDAMILAEKIPAGMIFLRSPRGISHDPAESVNREDVARALECGLHLLDQLARSVEFQKRMCRA